MDRWRGSSRGVSFEHDEDRVGAEVRAGAPRRAHAARHGREEAGLEHRERAVGEHADSRTRVGRIGARLEVVDAGSGRRPAHDDVVGVGVATRGAPAIAAEPDELHVLAEHRADVDVEATSGVGWTEVGRSLVGRIDRHVDPWRRARVHRRAEIDGRRRRARVGDAVATLRRQRALDARARVEEIVDARTERARLVVRARDLDAARIEPQRQEHARTREEDEPRLRRHVGVAVALPDRAKPIEHAAHVRRRARRHPDDPGLEPTRSVVHRVGHRGAVAVAPFLDDEHLEAEALERKRQAGLALGHDHLHRRARVVAAPSGRHTANDRCRERDTGVRESRGATLHEGTISRASEARSTERSATRLPALEAA